MEFEQTVREAINGLIKKHDFVPSPNPLNLIPGGLDVGPAHESVKAILAAHHAAVAKAERSAYKQGWDSAGGEFGDEAIAKAEQAARLDEVHTAIVKCPCELGCCSLCEYFLRRNDELSTHLTSKSNKGGVEGA